MAPLSQVKVHREDGNMEYESTYGNFQEIFLGKTATEKNGNH
jgi:hypothetical protein